MLFKKSNKRALVLLRDDRIEVFVLNRVKGSWRLAQGTGQDIPEGAQTSDHLAPLVQRLNTHGLKTTVALGTGHATTKVIEVPSRDPDEIRSIIDLQAGRHTPFAREDIVVSHQIITPFQRSYTKVLLVIVNRQTLEEQRRLLEGGGLIVDQFLFEPEAIVSCLAHHLPLPEEHPPIGVLDVGRRSSGFSVMINRRLAYCRRWPVGAAVLGRSDDRRRWEQHFTESVEGYHQEDVADPPGEVVVWAPVDHRADLAAFCATSLGAKVRVFEKRFDDLWDKSGAVSEEDLDPSVPALIETLERLEIDLTPEDLKAQRAIEEKGRQLIQTGVLVVTLLVLVCILFFIKLSVRQIQYQAVRRQYFETRRRVAVLDNIAQKSRVIKNYLRLRRAPMQVLKAVYDLTPNEIYYNTVTLEEDGTVILNGISESMSTVFDLVTALEETDVFKNVKTTSTSAKKDRGKDVAAFTIQMRLESRPDEEEPDNEEDQTES